MNYEQFKKIIILHQQFQDASKLRQLTRMKELPYEEQLEL